MSHSASFESGLEDYSTPPATRMTSVSFSVTAQPQQRFRATDPVWVAGPAARPLKSTSPTVSLVGPADVSVGEESCSPMRAVDVSVGEVSCSPMRAADVSVGEGSCSPMRASLLLPRMLLAV